MSFLKTAGSIASAVGGFAASSINTVVEKGLKLRQIKEEFEMKSDNDLMKIIESDGFFGPSDDEKNIARYILRERGVL